MPVRGGAPGVMRVAVLRDTAVGSGVGRYAIIQAVAPSLRVELRPIDMRDPGEIERAVVAFARVPNSGLIVVGYRSGTFSSKSDHHAKKVSIRPDEGIHRPISGQDACGWSVTPSQVGCSSRLAWLTHFQDYRPATGR